MRHEDLIVGDTGIAAIVEHIEFLGPVSRIDCRVGEVRVSSVVLGAAFPDIGTKVHLTVRKGSEHVFEERRP